jgi:hypothetical protein
MATTQIVCTFDREDDIVRAAAASRERGVTIADAYAPYPVHGLAAAMGLPASRLPLVCCLLGVVSGALTLWFQYWASAVSWPTNVGGRPWNSFPAFVPVTFEVVVLVAGVGTVAAFIAITGLRPQRHVEAIDPRVTDDRFALVLVGATAEECADIRVLMTKFRAASIEERTA